MTIVNDIKRPQGSNELSSKDIFYWRSIYKTYGPSYNTLDMYYEDVFYGRINKKGVAIYPSESALKQITSPQTVYGVNFVVDAWEGFKIHIKNSIADGSVRRGSIYSNLEVQSGWKSVHTSYHEWNDNLYQLFNGEFMNSFRKQKITDFQGYIDVYLEFVDNISRFFPYTRESFILSRMCSPLISGLVIEIADLPHGEDSAKRLFLKDASYNKVVRKAKKYGFKIDKNAPWRFIADLESERMQGYMSQYTSSTAEESILDQIYYKSYEKDIELFKHYIWAWYDQLVKTSPFVHKIISTKSSESSAQTLFESKQCDGKTISLRSKREILTKEQAFEKFPDEFWVRLYAYVRAKEAQKQWRQPKFDKVVKKTLDLMRIKEDNDAAMEYLYKEIETPGKKRLEMKKSFTEEQISGILIEKGLNKRKGTFNF